MAFGEGKIWYDGRFVDWADATCHVMSHALHYGSSVFEGIRCYARPAGPAVFRLDDHLRRLYDSAKIYRMEIPFGLAQLRQAVLDTVRVNGLSSCYIRPLAFRGMKAMGVNPLTCPVKCVIAAWDWGKYLGEDSMVDGVSVRVSSWRRAAPDTFPALAKAGGNYLNSQLIKIEATQDGFDEGIALDHYGFVSEGSGENIFMVRNGVIYTPPSSSSILPGVTRHCVFTLAREMGVRIHQQVIPREALYIADEVFFSGTAAEITPVTRIDNIAIGDGRRGPVTERIQGAFFEIVEGGAEDRHNWFTPVGAAAPGGKD
ncbi:MAG: branched-chain amino acid transaminase [Lentisphaerae bacterium]|nr:branched-chain amino acid transaminase [Lentisphaerota bacterium]